MSVKKIIIAICSLLFIMIGLDKFLAFLEPPCSLIDNIPVVIWKVLGALQIIAAVLIWLPKYRPFIAGFFAVFMIVFSIVHLTQGTHDIGGAAFMAVLLGILVWDPNFIRGRQSKPQ